MPKTLEYYRALPYRKRVKPDTDDGEDFFVAWVEELDGLVVDGETREEALYNLDSAFDDYIEALIEWGRDIPEPRLWPAGYDGRSDRTRESPVADVVEIDIGTPVPERENLALA